MESSYRVAGIDVHKKMLAVVITDAGREGEFRFERRKFGALPGDLRLLREWLKQEDVQEVVMESTAQYWKPVWQELEGPFRLHLAQAQSNRAPRGRKRDFADAERLVRRHIAGELILSFVPDAEQRLWRMLTRSRQQLRRDKVRLQNQLEALLETGRIKLGTQLSDLLGVSGRRMLRALAKGETDAARLAELADPKVRATAEQLRDALSAAASLPGCYRCLLQQFLDRLDLIEAQMEELQKSIAAGLKDHEEAVARLAGVCGLGVDSAQQIIAEVGPKAEVFPPVNRCAPGSGPAPGERSPPKSRKAIDRRRETG